MTCLKVFEVRPSVWRSWLPRDDIAVPRRGGTDIVDRPSGLLTGASDTAGHEYRGASSTAAGARPIEIGTAF